MKAIELHTPIVLSPGKIQYLVNMRYSGPQMDVHTYLFHGAESFLRS